MPTPQAIRHLTSRQAAWRRESLPSYLKAIRRSALLGARAADGLEPEAHEHFKAILAHATDATSALKGVTHADRVRFAHDDALSKASFE